MRTLRKRNTKLQAVSVRTYHYILVQGIHSNIITIAITTLDKKKVCFLNLLDWFVYQEKMETEK